MKNNMPDFDEFRNLSDEERRAKMDQKREEMEQWASDNSLDLQTFHDLMGQRKFMMRMPH
jgi:hypothetical protein